MITTDDFFNKQEEPNKGVFLFLKNSLVIITQKLNYFINGNFLFSI